MGKYTFTISTVGALTVIGVYALLTTYFFESGLRRRTSADLLQLQSPNIVKGFTQQVSSINSKVVSVDSANVSRNVGGLRQTGAHQFDKQSRLQQREGRNIADMVFMRNKRVGNASYGPSILRFEANTDLQINRGCSWANFTVNGPPYFLTAVFIVRIYENDLSELTTAEIKQWLVYLRYAGVQHVYLYDLWYLPGESQRERLDVFIREGYLTYMDRHELNPYVREKSQLPSYQHCIDVFGKDCVWQAAIDIDEYPFSSDDTRPGFMSRFVDKYSTKNTDVSEITMQNFLYLGAKDKSKEFLIDQLWRHTHGPSNALVKPIYKSMYVRRAQVHHNMLRKGRSKGAPNNGLRINHYWGARLQNWGPDTEESLAKTEEDRGMEPILAALRTCEKYIQPYL